MPAADGPRPCSLYPAEDRALNAGLARRDLAPCRSTLRPPRRPALTFGLATSRRPRSRARRNGLRLDFLIRVAPPNLQGTPGFERPPRGGTGPGIPGAGGISMVGIMVLISTWIRTMNPAVRETRMPRGPLPPRPVRKRWHIGRPAPVPVIRRNRRPHESCRAACSFPPSPFAPRWHFRPTAPDRVKDGKRHGRIHRAAQGRRAQASKLPFAQPADRDLRWREPQPAKNWPGVRNGRQVRPTACSGSPRTRPTGSRRPA